MGMVQEFKDFINKGNVLDLAVGVVMGGAFGKIVDSVVTDLINPLIGKLMGGVDLASNYVNLTDKTFDSYADAKKAGAAVLGYGSFINQVINFIIVAFAIFMIVKAYNKMKKPVEAAAPAGPTDVELLAEIRDLLKK